MLVMAIDPGRDKTGIAIVDSSRKVYFKDIVSTEAVISCLRDLSKEYKIDIIILGNGTYSGNIYKQIKKNLPLPVEFIDERNSTFRAEKKYRQEKQGWLSRLIQWKPDRPLDDYAAVVLAERYLENK